MKLIFPTKRSSSTAHGVRWNVISFGNTAAEGKQQVPCSALRRETTAWSDDVLMHSFALFTTPDGWFGCDYTVYRLCQLSGKVRPFP